MIVAWIEKTSKVRMIQERKAKAYRMKKRVSGVIVSET